MKQTLEQAAEAYSAKRVGGIILDDDVNAFKAGAEWQKKQDELTWEDMLEICATADFLFENGHWWEKYTREELYTEVLKRFKEYKEQKNKYQNNGL